MNNDTKKIVAQAVGIPVLVLGSLYAYTCYTGQSEKKSYAAFDQRIREHFNAGANVYDNGHSVAQIVPIKDNTGNVTFLNVHEANTLNPDRTIKDLETVPFRRVKM